MIKRKLNIKWDIIVIAAELTYTNKQIYMNQYILRRFLCNITPWIYSVVHSRFKAS